MTLKSVKYLFKDSEIFATEKFFIFIEKFKIVVFVPESHVENLAEKMSIAGAGVIGNYEMCSFRTEGTGTFKPGKKARPFSGKKNKLSFEKEVKLEMECGPENLNKVIDAVLKYHPYEEVVYEVYSFQRRCIKNSGTCIELKSEMKIQDLLKRLNKDIDTEINLSGKVFKKIILTESNADEAFKKSAGITGSSYILTILKNNFKLINI